jgi:hypothetical protein
MRHITPVTKPQRLPFTRYHTVRQKDGTYAVEITKAGEAVPLVVTGFNTEAEADGWTTNAQLTEAEHAATKK